MKISRNSFCPCGSKKKYKKCCLEKDKRKETERIYVGFMTGNEKRAVRKETDRKLAEFGLRNYLNL